MLPQLRCQMNGSTSMCFVNNAGLSRGLAKVYEQDPEDWQEMIDTNVMGLLHVTRAIVPTHGGARVLATSSTWAQPPDI